MLWLVLSLLAAIFWGLNYVSAERLLGRVSAYTLVTLELIIALLMMLLLGWWKGTFPDDAATIMKDRTLWWFLILSMASFALGNLMIVLSVAAKNATLAGLIEISYPLFIALFTWLILRQNYLTKPILLGAAFIFAGVIIIYLAS